MAVEVFTTPNQEVPLPEWNFKNTTEQNQQAEDAYIAKLIEYLHRKGYRQPDTGYILKFQVGDGHAKYMVISTDKPRVFELELDDHWQYPIGRFSKKGFLDEIKSQKAWDQTLNKLKGGK